MVCQYGVQVRWQRASPISKIDSVIIRARNINTWFKYPAFVGSIVSLNALMPSSRPNTLCPVISGQSWENFHAASCSRQEARRSFYSELIIDQYYLTLRRVPASTKETTLGIFKVRVGAGMLQWFHGLFWENLWRRLEHIEAMTIKHTFPTLLTLRC